MKNAIATLLIADLYLLVYYRLLVRFYYQKASGRSESGLAAIFSAPPYRILPERGRKYARRYWAAVGILLVCVGILFIQSDLH